MKILQKKSILQKTILVILTVLLMNFIVPTYSHADFGGVLLSPIVDLFCSLGDAVINLLQLCMTGEFGSRTIDGSFNAFLEEDNEFFGNNKYSDMQYNSADEIYNKTGSTSTYIEEIDVDSQFEKGWFGLSNKYHIPIATYSPEQIFTNNVPGLDINFISPNHYQKADGTEVESSASQLQPTIAKWYVALRNLSIVGLLSVLVYVGIRILISSTAADKAKYKQMFTDWLIALCLLFFLHYIMSFVLTLTESITQAIGGDGKSTIFIHAKSSDNASGYFSTNLLGMARFKTQYKDFFPKMAYLALYLGLVFYTCKFTWMYLKRMLMMAFLTLIAPLVALTYPIDKIGDGSAQAFNTWLKEYIFNALLQPFHLIIYIVFVGTAMDLVQTNIVYAIVAMGFIPTAEKILRNIFGFNKAGAGTVGALGGFAAANILNKLGKGKGSSGAKSGAGKQGSEQEKPPRFEKKHDPAQIGAPEGQSSENANDSEEEQKDNSQSALDKYKAEGFGQNANGEYYNPWTDEYDANYDPTKDVAYNPQLEKQQSKPQPQSGSSDQGQPDNESEDNKEKTSKFANWRRYHNITLAGAGEGIKKIGKGATRSIVGVAKFGTRTAFKAGAGTLAAAVAVASGGGVAGATAAFMAGANVGGRMGTHIANAGGAVVSGIGHGLERVVNTPVQAIKAEKGHRKQAAADALLGGTALGRELDIANGNTRYQDVASKKEWKEDKNNVQYVKDMMTAQNGGVVPSAKEVKAQMNKLDPYIEQGITDIKTMLKAQKVAHDYHISDSQSAIIAAIGKERGITADILKDEKKVKPEQAKLQQDFMSKGYSQADAAKQANYTINVLKAQNNVAHNLIKPVDSEKK